MRNKKILGALLAVTTLATFGLAGCGNSGSNGAASKEDDKTITVAASPTPHAEILNKAVKPLVEKDGYKLVVKEFTDYVQPNTATEDGEVDANYFQHKPYLDNFNKEKGTHLVSVEGIHFEPFGLYPGKTKELKNLQDGATVAVPNDATNEARALLLLQDAGLIKLKDPKDINATPKDITSNPKNLKFKELEAAVVPTVIKDVDIAALNGNYAIQAGFDPTKDTLATEKADGLAAKTYQNILGVKEGNENTAKTKELKKALKSDEVRDYINKNYKGAVVSVVENPTDGYDSSIDYDALNGETVSCAATPAPHCEVLEICKDILAAKGITLDIQEYDDYVIPNTIVEDGQCDTNYFQHQPYLDNFNEEKGTHLVTVAGIHVEPMGIYGGKQDSLAPIEG